MKLNAGALSTPHMTRFKALARFDKALAGEDPSEVEWAISFAKSMLRGMRLKSGVDEWRQRKEQAEARYLELRQRPPS